MQAEIKEKKEIAKGTLMVKFSVIGEEVNFQSGQYFFITLPKLRFPDQRGSQRHFSIVNSPNEKGIITLVTRLRNSGFKRTLKELPLGSKVEVGPIAGSFTLPESTVRPLVLIAGGIGITPFMSMLRFISEENLLYRITLIYSNRDKVSAPFYEELTNLSEIIPNFKLIFTMTEDKNWSGEKRRIDAQFIRDYVEDLKSALFYIAGPPGLNETVIMVLQGAGAGLENIKTDNFTGY